MGAFEPAASLSKFLEPIRRHLCVPHGVLNVTVPEVLLDGPRVVAIVRKLKAAGVTEQSTVDDPAIISGFYWSGRRWVDDRIVMLFIDFPGAPDAVIDEAKRIKARIAEFYKEEGSPQEELWCTAEQIQLIV